MATKDPPFGMVLDRKSLGTHMPRKETVHEREVVHVVPEHKDCTYTVEFERDEYGRIKSPIIIRPQ
jgi:hypothetical protein